MNLNSSNPVKISRIDLTAMVYLLCQYLGIDLAAFKAVFPNIYTGPEFIVQLRKDADAVLAMPTPTTRVADRKKARLEMIRIQLQQRESAARLQGYIIEAFPAEDVASNLGDAGITIYRAQADRRNWSAVHDFFSTMDAYLTANQAFLLERGSMPVGFPAEVLAQSQAFTTNYLLFKDAAGNSKMATSGVTAATEALQKRVMGILANGRATFINERAKRNLYTFASLRREAVSSRSVGGIRFGLIDAVSSRPIKGAIVSTPYFNIQTTSNAKGRIVLQPMINGTYTVNVAAEGYPNYQIVGVPVAKSRRTTLKTIALEPLVAGMTVATTPVSRLVAEELMEKAAPKVAPAPVAPAAPVGNTPKATDPIELVLPEFSDNGTHG